jgi:hypothetical protein
MSGSLQPRQLETVYTSFASSEAPLLQITIAPRPGAGGGGGGSGGGRRAEEEEEEEEEEAVVNS